MMMKKLVILDRDGVINYDSEAFIKSPEEWHPIPGSLEAIVSLNQAGYLVCIATNQSGLARKLFDAQRLDQIHQKMKDYLAYLGGRIDGIFFCPHGPDDNCLCRKPKPGLLHQIAEQFSIDFKKDVVPCIGDSLRDIEAAALGGCRPILVKTGNGLKTAQNLPEHLKHIEQYSDLRSVTKALLRESSLNGFS